MILQEDRRIFDSKASFLPTEEWSTEFVNNSEEVFWIRDGDSMVYVNPAVRKVFGLDTQVFYRDLYILLEIIDEKDRERVALMLKEDGAHGGINYNIEFKVCLPGGERRWIWLKTFRIDNSDGTIGRKAATAIDITSRKEIEEELSRNNRELEILYELFKKASEQAGLDELLFTAQKSLVEHLNVDAACIYFHDSEMQHLDIRSSLGFTPELLTAVDHMPINRGMCWKAFRTKQRHLSTVKDYPEGEIRKALEMENIHHIGCFPIINGDIPLGTLTLLVKSENALYESRQEFILTLCNQLAVLINNAMLYEQVKRELTIRKKVEQENELILNTSVDLIAIMDSTLCIERVNPQWGHVLGWGDEELLGKCFLPFVYWEDREFLNRTMERLFTDRVVMGCETRCAHKNGQFLWISWNARIVTDLDRVLIIMTGRDISYDKAMEEKTRELERVVHIESVKMEFFANISHEFRTPLNIILSTVQLLQPPAHDNFQATVVLDRFNRHLKSIKQNAFRLLRLVNNLIDLTKLDSGYFKLYKKNHNIVSIVESITQSVAQYIEGKGINLIFDTDLEEIYMACDADMIERIMLNLLSNAVKYTEKDGFIKVNICDKKTSVVISVRDTGIGIPEDKLDIIFERFVQGDRPLTRRCEGSGIGLSLVKSLVELHNGRVWVTSSLNKGSEFSVELPVAVMEEENLLPALDQTDEERIHKINVEFSDIYSLNTV